MITIKDEKQCCGCGACASVCPRGCIEMSCGTLGHKFPTIDESKCVDCGLCENVCPMNAEFSTRQIKKVYAAYSLDQAIRFRGASGGMAETFASSLMEKGYVVFGAAFDEQLKLTSHCAEDKEQLPPLLKSKYLQCDFRNSYQDIRNRLQEEEKVLLISTPCQISALKSFLGKDYSNLITIDFFCHGVPSQRFFDECMEYDITSQGIGKVRQYEFRTKVKNGSTPHYYSIKTEDGETKTGYYFDSTNYAFFQKYINLRESCYDCRFSSEDRCSDLTIGDFHEIDHYCKGINRFDGVSTVIINTEKGAELFNNCKKCLWTKEMDYFQLKKDGAIFPGGTKCPRNRDQFVQDYQTMDIGALAKKYVNKRRYVKMRIYYSMPSFVRRMVKRSLGK